jgi:hypothetical protein
MNYLRRLIRIVRYKFGKNHPFFVVEEDIKVVDDSWIGRWDA